MSHINRNYNNFTSNIFPKNILKNMQINILVKDITWKNLFQKTVQLFCSSSLRIGWIFMAKSSMSKGEITRSYHFYWNFERRPSRRSDKSFLSNFLACNYSFNCWYVRRGLFSHKFNAGCGSAASVRGNEVRSLPDLHNPILRIFFTATYLRELLIGRSKVHWHFYFLPSFIIESLFPVKERKNLEYCIDPSIYIAHHKYFGKHNQYSNLHEIIFLKIEPSIFIFLC